MDKTLFQGVPKTAWKILVTVAALAVVGGFVLKPSDNSNNSSERSRAPRTQATAPSAPSSEGVQSQPRQCGGEVGKVYEFAPDAGYGDRIIIPAEPGCWSGTLRDPLRRGTDMTFRPGDRVQVRRSDGVTWTDCPGCQISMSHKNGSTFRFMALEETTEVEVILRPQ